MSGAERLSQLARLAGVIRDLRLAEFESAGRARAESRQRLAGLAREPCPSDLGAIAAVQAEVRYHAWAEARRAEINLTLARQTAEWLEAQDAARKAFGRAVALQALASAPRR
jgi:hypothetical protein